MSRASAVVVTQAEKDAKTIAQLVAQVKELRGHLVDIREEIDAFSDQLENGPLDIDDIERLHQSVSQTIAVALVNVPSPGK